MTDRYGVIGHPIAHSKSPIIHQQFAKQARQSLQYDAIDIEPANLSLALNTLAEEGVKGLNVTVPHKNAVIELMDELTKRAELAGAVNTISIDRQGTMIGDNTDGVGLQRDLKNNLHIELTGKNVLVLGAGGATRGIVPMLLESEPTSLSIANRTLVKAEVLIEQFEDDGEISAWRFEELDGQQFDVIINATSAGLTGDVPPFPSSIIEPETICYDLSYAMTDTPFCAWAKEHGAKHVHQGWGMLVEQAAESFLVWRGMRPKTSPVLKNLPK